MIKSPGKAFEGQDLLRDNKSDCPQLIPAVASRMHTTTSSLAVVLSLVSRLSKMFFIVAVFIWKFNKLG